MRLIYRGTSYNSSPSIEMPESEITGKYRGTPISIKSPVVIQPSDNVQLVYRGIRYTKAQ